jgi:hypothetical protein
MTPAQPSTIRSRRASIKRRPTRMGTEDTQPAVADLADGVTDELAGVQTDERRFLDHHLEELLATIGEKTVVLGDEDASDL